MFSAQLFLQPQLVAHKDTFFLGYKITFRLPLSVRQAEYRLI